MEKCNISGEKPYFSKNIFASYASPYFSQVTTGWIQAATCVHCHSCGIPQTSLPVRKHLVEMRPSDRTSVPFPPAPPAAWPGRPSHAGFISQSVSVTDSSNKELSGAEHREGERGECCLLGQAPVCSRECASFHSFVVLYLSPSTFSSEVLSALARKADCRINHWNAECFWY